MEFSQQNKIFTYWFIFLIMGLFLEKIVNIKLY